MSTRLIDRMAWMPVHVVVPDECGDCILTVHAKADMLPGEFAAMRATAVALCIMLMAGRATAAGMRQTGKLL